MVLRCWESQKCSKGLKTLNGSDSGSSPSGTLTKPNNGNRSPKGEKNESWQHNFLKITESVCFSKSPFRENYESHGLSQTCSTPVGNWNKTGNRRKPGETGEFRAVLWQRSVLSQPCGEPVATAVTKNNPLGSQDWKNPLAVRRSITMCPQGSHFQNDGWQPPLSKSLSGRAFDDLPR